jgi:hypothetical protein
MTVMSSVARLMIAPPGPYGDPTGAARRMSGFAQTVDADWTEIGVDERRGQNDQYRPHGQRRTRHEHSPLAAEPPVGFAAQMIAQGMGKGAHLENFSGVSAAYQRAESAPHAPRRGAGVSLTV